MNPVLCVPCTPAAFTSDGQSPGSWGTASPSSGGAPEGREWAWVATSGALTLALSTDGGATKIEIGNVDGVSPSRIAVPAGCSLWARHPGDAADTRYLFSAWSER